MPYTVVKRDGEYCVVKRDDPDGKTFGCHPTAEKAGAQIGAIEHSEARKSVVDMLKELVAKFAPAPDDAREDTDKDDYAMTVPIYKADSAQQKVWAVVLEPYTVDAQGDWETPDEIEKACHAWMENWQAHNIRHKGDVNKDIRTVECYIAPTDFALGAQPVRKGSWVMGVHILDGDVWQQVEKGELNGFSIEGYGRRQKRAVAEVVHG